MSKIHNQLKTVNGLLCLLLTIGILPVLIWHSWGVLSGVARVSLLGYAIADLALWASAIFAVTAASGLVRAVALASKATLAALLLLCAASVITIHAGDQRREVAADRAAAAEARRLATIAGHARDLAATSGRSVAREFIETAGAAGGATSLPSSPGDSPDAWLDALPAWWPGIGIIATPTLAGLFVIVLLTAVVALGGPGPGAERSTIEEEAFEEVPTRRAGFATPRRQYVNFRRGATVPTEAPTPPAGGHTDAGADAGGIRYEKKKNGRVEAWIPDASTARGKRYLTSFPASLSIEEQASRVRSAMARKEVTA
jgi:hypothetical protein